MFHIFKKTITFTGRVNISKYQRRSDMKMRFLAKAESGDRGPQKNYGSCRRNSDLRLGWEGGKGGSL